MANSILTSHYSGTSNTILVSHGWPSGSSANPVLQSHDGDYPASGDTTPAAFTFTDQTGVATSTTITSAPITITGINAAATVTITGGTYQINGAGGFVSTSGTVNNLDTIIVRHTSSGSNSTATNTVLTVGGVSDTFTSTTVAAAGGTLLISTDFESGNYAVTGGGSIWDNAATSIQTAPTGGGTYALRFRHPAEVPATGTDGSNSELRFDLGSHQPEVWMTWKLWIPANWGIRARPDYNTINKLFFLWANNYNDYNQVSSVMWKAYPDESADPNQLALAVPSWNETFRNPKYFDFITTTDIGTWVTLKVQIVAAQSAVVGGEFRMWKNGSLMFAHTNTSTWDSTPGAQNNYRYGYIMGWHNSGYDVETDYFADQLRMGTTEASIA